MNFTWLSKQGVRSDTGFKLQSMDRFTFEYREGSRTITLDIESGILGENQPAILMGSDALKKWDNGTTLDVVAQKQVLDNIRQALAFQGLGLSIE